jgi:glycosyltransferase involved in cell wall biosynthesis
LQQIERPTIHLFADVLGGYGGIETYLDALARRLAADGWPVRVAVSLNAPAPFLNAIEALGVPVYRQPRVPGDRWRVRQRLLAYHVAARVHPGDWVYCVRQPMPGVYSALVRAVHARRGKVAASWMLAPEFLPLPAGQAGALFKRAVAETDAVISVSECTRGQFAEVYGYTGPVAVVRYHNIELLPAIVPLPPAPPFRIGFLGRVEIAQKNLDTILDAYRRVAARRGDVVYNFHGGGADLETFRTMVAAAGLGDRVRLHGPYDHRRDLASIMAQNHLFIYASRFEGGPCFSLLELLQAGRFVVTSPVGGIPDIYAGRAEIGTLVDAADADAIAAALDDAIARLAAGKIDPHRIRAAYAMHFTDNVAHEQWMRALGIASCCAPPDRVMFPGSELRSML